MRLNTYLSDGGIHEILSVDSIEEAREVLRQRLDCEELGEVTNGEIIEFFDPKREANLWAQGYDTDDLGGLIGRLETKWHYAP